MDSKGWRERGQIIAADEGRSRRDGRTEKKKRETVVIS
jgi:hypothetical protein